MKFHPPGVSSLLGTWKSCVLAVSGTANICALPIVTLPMASNRMSDSRFIYLLFNLVLKNFLQFFEVTIPSNIHQGYVVSVGNSRRTTLITDVPSLVRA